MPRKRQNVPGRWKVRTRLEQFLIEHLLTSPSEDGDGMTRSGTPNSMGAGDGEGSEEPTSDTQERHRELMNKIFTHNPEGDIRRSGEQYFPRHEELTSVPSTLKKEFGGDMREGSQPAPVTTTTQPDVVMKETVEAQAEERAPEQDAQRVVHEQPGEGSTVQQQPTAAAA